MRRADIARDRGDAAAAVILYDKVIARWGAHFGILMQLGNALKDSHRYEEADATYLEALALRPDDADAFLQRGHLMKTSGDLDSAWEFYKKASELDPRLRSARHELEALERATGKTGDQKVVRVPLRPDLPYRASIVMHRLVNQYRWRRG